MPGIAQIAAVEDQLKHIDEVLKLLRENLQRSNNRTKKIHRSKTY
jgi:hypothetical protein